MKNSDPIKHLMLAEAQLNTEMNKAQLARVRSLSPRLKSRAAEAPTAGAPATKDLNDMLNNVLEVPGSTSVAEVPLNNQGSISPEIHAGLFQCMSLDSYISILTAYSIYNEHPAPYDISDPKQATAFTKATAKWRNYVMTGGVVKALATYMPVGNIVAGSMDKMVVGLELNLELLAEMFGSFGFSEAIMTQLKGIIDSQAASLQKVDMSYESIDQTLDHFVSFYYPEQVMNTGEGTGLPAMYVWKIRMFYLKIDQSDWKIKIGPSVSAKKFRLKVNYFDVTTTVNTSLVARDQGTIDATMQTLTGKDAAAVNALMNMKAVTSDPKSA